MFEIKKRPQVIRDLIDKAKLRRIRQTIAEFDLIIASIALPENYILVINNTSYYERLNGLKLENLTLP